MTAAVAEMKRAVAALCACVGVKGEHRAGVFGCLQPPLDPKVRAEEMRAFLATPADPIYPLVDAVREAKRAEHALGLVHDKARQAVRRATLALVEATGRDEIGIVRDADAIRLEIEEWDAYLATGKAPARWGWKAVA